MATDPARPEHNVVTDILIEAGVADAPFGPPEPHIPKKIRDPGLRAGARGVNNVQLADCTSRRSCSD